MAGINRVTLVGRLGADVDLKYSSNGGAMANIPIATSDEWKDKTGEKQERVEWHKVCLYGPIAEIAAKYLTKGSEVYIEGKNRTRKYKDASGQDSYITEVIVSGYEGKMHMLGGGGQRQNNTQNPQLNTPQQTSAPRPEAANNQNIDPRYMDDAFSSDPYGDVPF